MSANEILETRQAVTNRDRDSRGIFDYPTSVMQLDSKKKYTRTHEHDPALVDQKNRQSEEQSQY